MTVSELIKHLQNYPGDMRVLTLGYEGGYDDVRIRTEDIIFDHNDKDTWYIGPHECARMVDNDSNGTECVIIGRGK